MSKIIQKFRESSVDIIILRLIIIIIFAVFANTKWFEFEVQLLKPLISKSWLSFLYDWFGFYYTSYLLGIIESLAYLSLAIGFFKPKIGILGSLLILCTALITVSLLVNLGFNGFIFKDLLLIGATLVLLKYDLKRIN